MATIQFMGICTHFKNSTTPMLGELQHRVVLINAIEGAEIAGINIPAHTPQIQFDQGPPFPLQGVHLSFTGPISQVIYVPNPDTITPSLGVQMSLLEALPAPSPELVLGELWPEVAAYIDINFGTLTASINPQGGAAMATLTMDGAVEMNAFPFPGAPTPQFGTSVPLGPDSVVTVSNTSDDETMSRGHFFLHYLLGVSLPSAPQVPVSPELTAALVGSGCSDSNYP